MVLRYYSLELDAALEALDAELEAELELEPPEPTTVLMNIH